MKTIGLIAGMSWESTVDYYKYINEEVKKKLGGFHSAKILMYSVDFQEIELMQHNGDWKKLGKTMSDIGVKLQNAGADSIVICTNTMHKLVPDMVENLNIPIYHIADATAEEIMKYKFKKVGLLGTKFTMEGEFYKKRIEDNYPIEVIIPPKEDREIVHKIIYDELCLGKIEDSSRKEYIRIVEELRKSGAEGVILGCTEIPLLLKEKDATIPLFDTTKIHSIYAVEKSLK